MSGFEDHIRTYEEGFTWQPTTDVANVCGRLKIVTPNYGKAQDWLASLDRHSPDVTLRKTDGGTYEVTAWIKSGVRVYWDKDNPTLDGVRVTGSNTFSLDGNVSLRNGIGKALL